MDKDTVTFGDLYELEKDNFTSFTGWSWVIMYRDKHNLRVRDILTDKLIADIDGGDNGVEAVFWRSALEVARKHGAI